MMMKKKKKLTLEQLIRLFVLKELNKQLNEAPMPPPLPHNSSPVKSPPAPQDNSKADSLSLTPLSGQWETGNLVQDAQKVLQSNADKLLKKGIHVDQLKQLGVGTMGVAYDMGGDKVLKVTKDPKEAKASSLVVGKNLPNIVKVYDIWQFPNVQWYGLIIEKLTPLSKEEEQALTSTVINTKFPVLLYQANDDWNEAMKLLAKQTMDGVVQQAYKQFPDAQQGQGIRDPRVQEFIRPVVQKKITDFDTLTKQYKMRELFKSLKTLGIRFFDFHGGNYGRRSDGTLVLFDLGRSISPGQLPGTLQEAYLKATAVILS
jgi:hypothetical protein